MCLVSHLQDLVDPLFQEKVKALENTCFMGRIRSGPCGVLVGVGGCPPLGWWSFLEDRLGFESDAHLIKPGGLGWREWSGCSLGRGSLAGWRVGGCFLCSCCLSLTSGVCFLFAFCLPLFCFVTHVYCS